MMADTALVLVAHSQELARGCAQVAAQMAPEVSIHPAGGAPDGGIGTSYDLVEDAVHRALAAGAGAVVLLADLGSATLIADAVLEMLDDDRLLLADAPFVEGAVAAAVAAQSGGGGARVRAAAQEAIGAFHPVPSMATEPEDEGEPVQRTLIVRNRLGLHARPAARVARQVAEFNARVSVNGVDATSVLALMGLGLTAGSQIDLVATGPQALAAIETISADVEAGFGEE